MWDLKLRDESTKIVDISSKLGVVIYRVVKIYKCHPGSKEIPLSISIEIFATAKADIMVSTKKLSSTRFRSVT